MSHTRLTSALACAWPRLTRPSLLGLLLVPAAVAAQPPTPLPAKTQPPAAISVDDIGAAFRQNMGGVLEQSLDLSTNQTRKSQKEAELNVAQEKDKKKLSDELAAINAKVAEQEADLKATLTARGQRIDKLVKEDLAKADPAEQVAAPLPHRRGARRRALPLYPVLPDFLDRQHPETKTLIAYTQPEHPLAVRRARPSRWVRVSAIPSWWCRR